MDTRSCRRKETVGLRIEMLEKNLKSVTEGQDNQCEKQRTSYSGHDLGQETTTV